MARKKVENESKTNALPVTETVAIGSIPLDRIDLGLNVRSIFDDDSMKELIDSVKLHGVLEPVLVCEDGEKEGRYVLLAGERRYRAAEAAELGSIPSRIMPALSDQQKIEIMLTENLSRKDLLPLEEAEGFRRLMDIGVKQKDICERLNRSQSYVSNRVRLLNLPDAIRQKVTDGTISPAHGIAVLAFENEPVFEEFCSHLSENKHLPEMNVDSIEGAFIRFIREHGNDHYHFIYELHSSIVNDKCQNCSMNFHSFCKDSECWRQCKETTDQLRSSSSSERSDLWTIREPLRAVHCSGCPSLVEEDGRIACPDRECLKRKTDAANKYVVSKKKESLDSLYNSISEIIYKNVFDSELDVFNVIADKVVPDLFSGDLVKYFQKKIRAEKGFPSQVIVSFVTSYIIMAAAGRWSTDVSNIKLKDLEIFLKKYSIEIPLPDWELPDDFFSDSEEASA